MKLFRIILIFILASLVSCLIPMGLKPSKFSIKYDGIYTGLDTLINLNGYYTSIGSGNESYGNFLFYNEGQVVFTNSGRADHYFEKRYKEVLDSWGTYRMSGNTIDVQIIVDQGTNGPGYRVLNFKFEIETSKSLVSLTPFDKGTIYTFYPLENKIDSLQNRYLKKGWYKK